MFHIVIVGSFIYLHFATLLYLLKICEPIVSISSASVFTEDYTSDRRISLEVE
jgi:hypothetical protein